MTPSGPKSRQEIFNEVAEHLLKQGAAAKDGICRYRTEVGGLKCAVGCLIADEAYSEDIEYMGVHNLLTSPTKTRELRAALTYSRIPTDTREDVEFLEELQIIHDTYEVEQWAGQLRGLAIRRGLTLPRCLQ